MDRKFILLEYDTCMFADRKLYRIQALRNFGNVRKYDLGGWVEKEENLSHKGYCWVYEDAKVYDNAIVKDNSMITRTSTVGGNAVIVDSAYIFRSNIYGESLIGGNAYIADSYVDGKSEVYDCCHVIEQSKIIDSILKGSAKTYKSDIAKSTLENASVSESMMINSSAFTDKISSCTRMVFVEESGLSICDSLLTDNVTIKIYGENIKMKNVTLRGDILIESPNDYITIGPLGSRNGDTTFARTTNNDIMVNCGCFNDTIDRFEKAVKETHKDNKVHLDRYMRTIKYAKEMIHKD